MTASPSRTTPRSLVIFILCALAMIAEGFDTYAVGYVGPALVKEWGVSQTSIGQVYAVGVVASLFGSLALGALSDWVGRKWLLVGSTLVFGLATLGSAHAPDLATLVFTRALAGIGLGASIPCAMALATEHASPRYKATTPVILSACIGVGVIVASLAAAAVMPAFGWRGLMYVGAIFPVVVVVLMAIVLPGGRAVPDTSEEAWIKPSWRDLVQPRLLLLTLIVTAAMTATYVVTFFFGFWLPTLVTSAAPDVRAVGLASAVIKTFGVLGSLTLGRLMDRYGMGRILPVAFVVAAGMLILTVSDSPMLAALVVGLSLASFFVDGAFSGIIGFSALVFPARVRGAGLGFTIGVGRLIGGTLGPMLGGVLLAQGLSVKAICAVFGGPLILAALLVVLANRVRRDRQTV